MDSKIVRVVMQFVIEFPIKSIKAPQDSVEDEIHTTLNSRYMVLTRLPEYCSIALFQFLRLQCSLLCF